MKRKKFKLFYFLFFFNLILFGNSNAETSKVEEISKNLRCLICQGQSVYDSNSEFALSVKTLISEKLAAGNSEDDIYNFLTLWYKLKNKKAIFNSGKLIKKDRKRESSFN